MLYPTELRDRPACLFAMGSRGQDWMRLQSLSIFFVPCIGLFQA